MDMKLQQSIGSVDKTASASSDTGIVVGNETSNTFDGNKGEGEEEGDNYSNSYYCSNNSIDLDDPTILLINHSIVVQDVISNTDNKTAAVDSNNKDSSNTSSATAVVGVAYSYSSSKIRYLLQFSVQLCLRAVECYKTSSVLLDTSITDTVLIAAATTAGVSASSTNSHKKSVVDCCALLAATAVECLSNIAYVAGPIYFQPYLMRLIISISICLFNIKLSYFNFFPKILI